MTVFRKVSVFLSPHEIYLLSILNRHFHAHFINSETQYYINLRKFSEILFQDLTEENFQRVVQTITGIHVSSISGCLDSCRPSSNLIQNPFGMNNFAHWEVSNGGDGWAVEHSWTFQNRPTCFVSSYRWGTLTQVIALPRLGAVKRKLFAGCPIRRRFDCGGSAKLIVKLVRDGGEETINEVEVECRELEGEDPEQRFPWDLMSICVDVDDQVGSARISFAGKDSRFWAGHYGPRFGYCFARILVVNEESEGANKD